MAEEFGTKDTKEALRAIIAIIEFILERTKDGIGFDDALGVWSKFQSDEVFKNKLKIGWDGKENLSKELGNMSVEEVTVLGFEIAPELVALLLKMRKE